MNYFYHVTMINTYVHHIFFFTFILDLNDYHPSVFPILFIIYPKLIILVFSFKALLGILIYLILILLNAVILSIIGLFSADIFQLIPVLIQLSFLLSPILYFKKTLQGKEWIFKYNPLYIPVGLVRDSIINSPNFTYPQLITTLFISLNLLYLIFRAIRKNARRLNLYVDK